MGDLLLCLRYVVKGGDSFHISFRCVALNTFRPLLNEIIGYAHLSTFTYMAIQEYSPTQAVSSLQLSVFWLNNVRLGWTETRGSEIPITNF